MTITDDTSVWAELAAYAGPHVAVEPVAPREALNYVPAAAEHGPLDVARFDRELDLAWRRSSYSSLTADAHAAHRGMPAAATSEPEESTVDDEADLEVDPAPDAAALPSPMADLPFGAAFGVLVHSVLETVDTAAPDLGAALAEAAAEQLARRPLAGVTAGELAAALEPVVRTPVDRPAGGAPWTYADIAPRDRLAELDFELPLAGGDREPEDREVVTLGRAAALLRAHLPADDPLAAYPEALGGAVRAGPAGLPHRQHRRRPARPRRPVRHRRPQDELARTDPAGGAGGRTPDQRALRPGADDHRDDPRALPAAGAALRGRAAPVPALAAARLRPRAPPRWGRLPVPARHVRAGHPGRRRHHLRGVPLVAAARAVVALSDLLAGRTR